MTDENEELHALKCSECGGDLIKSYRVEYDEDEEESENIPIAKCASCGKEYDQYTEEYYGVYADDLTYDKDNTVFKLGAKGKIDDVEYEVIGRIRYQEEDEYEKSTWDEWFAVSADGVYHYLVEEEGKVFSYEDYVPQSIDLESDPNSIEFEGRSYSKENDGYVGRVVLAEGELPWQPEIGEASTMYDIKKGGVKYSIEASEGEVSITRGKRMPYKEVIEAFGSEEDRELYKKTMEGRKLYSRKGHIYLAAAALMFVLSIYNCSSSSPVMGVMKSGVALSNNQPQVDQGKQVYVSKLLYGPYPIKKSNSLYSVTVSIDERVQRLHLEWESFRFMLIPEKRLQKALKGGMTAAALIPLFNEIDAQKDPVECYSLGGDFWDEQGYDSDGYWHENKLAIDDDFVLDNAGNYYSYFELYSKNPRDINCVKYRMTRTKGYRYYVILFFVFGILFVVNKIKSKSFNELSFVVAGDEG